MLICVSLIICFALSSQATNVSQADCCAQINQQVKRNLSEFINAFDENLQINISVYNKLSSRELRGNGSSGYQESHLNSFDIQNFSALIEVGNSQHHGQETQTSHRNNTVCILCYESSNCNQQTRNGCICDVHGNQNVCTEFYDRYDGEKPVITITTTNKQKQWDCKGRYNGRGKCYGDNSTTYEKCAKVNCSANAVCDENSGNCKCADGFNGLANNCKLKNKCTNVTCSDNATCIENSGTCECLKGYVKSEKLCKRKKSCADEFCGEHASCDEQSGKKCKCDPGFVGNGLSCENTTRVFEQIAQLANTTSGVETASARLREITFNQKPTKAVAEKAVDFFVQAKKNALSGKVKITAGAFSSMAFTASSLAKDFFKANNESEFNSTSHQQNKKMGSDLVKSITALALKVVFNSSQSSLNLTTDSMQMTISENTEAGYPSLTYTPSGVGEGGISIFVPGEATKRAWGRNAGNITRAKRQATNTSDGGRRSAFIYHSDSTLFYSEQNVTSVIAADLGAPVYNLTELVKITHSGEVAEYGKKPLSNNTLQALQTSLKCAYWNFDTDDWASDGCCLNSADPPECHCNHLTNFALLVVSNKVPADVVLSVVSDVGCVISILGLLATIIIHVMSRDVRKRRPAKILMHICANLMASYLIFVAGVSRAQNNQGACTFVAALLHYFMLVTWCWMTVYSYDLYMSVVKVFRSSKQGFLQRVAAFAYLTPLVIVGLTLGVAVGYFDQQPTPNNNFCTGVADPLAKSHYRAANMCWLTEYSLYFGFLLPVGVLLLFNCIVFSSVFREISCKNVEMNSSAAKRTNKQTFMVAVTMTTFMGITWLFGYLMLLSDDVIYLRVMGWVFALFNTLQGLGIFLLTSLRSEDLRKIWWKPLSAKTRSLVRFSRKDHDVRALSDDLSRQKSQVSQVTMDTELVEQNGGCLQVVEDKKELSSF